MAGYIRNDTTNNIADGNIINAADLDGEFDAIASAFTQGGHNHDGTAQQGGPVSKIGPSQQIEVTNTTLQPKTNNTTDLGTLGLRFKDLFMHDNNVINLGNDSDVTIGYDETTTDSLKIAAKDGAGLAITLMADRGDDAGDEWKLNVADGGVVTFGNDIASEGTYVTHLTLTPHATVAQSKLDLAGVLQVSNGTAAIPSLTATTDPDTGFFFGGGGTNALSFASGGVAQFTMIDGAITPLTTSDINLGTDLLYFKDAFIDKITTSGVIELGHADQTTLSGSSGVLSVEGVAVLVAGAQTGLTTDFNVGRKVGRDADNVVDFATTDDEIQFVAAGTKRVTIDANGLTVDSGSIETATIDYIDGDLAMTIADGGGVTFAQGVTITGDLTVNGATTTVNTATLSVEDPLIILAKANDSSDTLDIGFYGLYDVGGTDKYAGLFRDASDGKFKLFKDLTAAPNTEVNVSGAGYAVGTLVANLEGDVSGATTIAGTTLIGKLKKTGGNDTFTLPADDGSAGQFLKTDASGNLGFATVALTTINSNTNHQVITGTGNTNELQGESGLTYNGSTLAVQGALTVTGNITAFFTSDQRLKENVVNIPNALDKVMNINGVEFDWSSEYIETHGGEDELFNRKHQVGVIAQEVEKVLPEVVADRPDGYKAVRYEQLVPLLIEAIKELKTELDTHKQGCKCNDVT